MLAFVHRHPEDQPTLRLEKETGQLQQISVDLLQRIVFLQSQNTQF